MKNQIQLRPSYWASVSGGKDSLYMLKLILSNPDKFKELIELMAQTEKVRENEYNKPFAIMDSRGKYNAEYIENNVCTKWLPKLEKMLKERDPE